MQGINFSSPSVVRALLASAALLTSVSTTCVRAKTPSQPDQYEETALAVPRFSPNGNTGEVSLPHPLDSADARQIRLVFDLQHKGEFQNAISETTKIGDDLLLGDILADRYLNSNYHPTIGQLKLWLKSFNSYTDAPAISKRLSAIAPIGTAIPSIHPLPALGKDTTKPNLQISAETDPVETAFRRNPLLDRTVHERTSTGLKGAQSALHLIKVTPGIKDLYAAQLQAEIASQLFSMGETDAALKIAQKSFNLSKGRIGLAGYTAGLAAWELDKMDVAFSFFEKASHSDLTSTSIRAGSFFWAGRAKNKLGDHQAYTTWLHRAASSSCTFYGILASHILGEDKKASAHPVIQPESIPRTLVLSQIDVDAINDIDLGKRFFALLQVGEKDRAETVLRQLWIKSQQNTALRRSIQLVAQAAELNDLSTQLATILEQEDGYIRNTALLPIPNLSPRHGYKINPALVYALTRLESNFNSHAVSGKGARGLMQIMPITARYIMKQRKDVTIRQPTQLQNAAVNLEVGQLYLLHLAGLSNHQNTNSNLDGGSLIHMLASYNAGPNALTHWSISDQQDPLLFIESIPVKETRNYLHRAFTYLWIYSQKLDLPTPSLDTLAHDQWPNFKDERNLAKTIIVH